MLNHKKSSERKILGVDYEAIAGAAEEKVRSSINNLEHKAKLGSIGHFFKAIVGYEGAKEECLRTNNGLYKFNGDMDALERGRAYSKRIEKIMRETAGNHWSY